LGQIRIVTVVKRTGIVWFERMQQGIKQFAAQTGVEGLLAPTIVPPSIGDTRDKPLAIEADKIEHVRPTVVYPAVHQKLERGPNYRQIVIDPH
jgi:hypothetical protein